MIDLNITLFIQLVNFLITLVVLNFLIIRPVRELIKKRNAKMTRLINEAETFSDAATAKLAGYEETLDKARIEAAAERDRLKAAGTEEEKRLVEQAGREAQATLESAREDIASQVSTAMDDLKGRVDGLARQAADKILG